MIFFRPRQGHVLILLLIAGLSFVLPVQAEFPQYRVLDIQPHNSKAFTQGLVADGDTMYESSGGHGNSFLSRYPLPGKTTVQKPTQTHQSLPLPRDMFAEGLTLFQQKLYLLSWKKGVASVYDPKTLSLLQQFEYPGEGWGLTHDGEQLIMSDGSATLQFRDPKSFDLIRNLKVRYQGRAVRYLNELEFYRGAIWANVWHQNVLIAIDPTSGEVKQVVNLEALKKSNRGRNIDHVLNGIAADPKGRGLWVTGKNWPRMYLIEIPSP